jgi:hypothetical protein
MVRAFIKNPLERTADNAVNAARVAIGGASGGSVNGSGALAISGTTAGLDGDGNATLTHSFFLGLDSLEDETAILAAPTKIINYVNY